LRVAELEKQMGSPDFWSNQEKAQPVVVELKSIKALLRPLDETLRSAEDLQAMVEMAEEDAGFAAEVPGALERLETRVEELETKALLNGPLDGNNAILTINARDGGTDASDWAEMLLRMYINWARENEYDVELLDRSDNEEAGINNASIAIRGPMAFGYLKGECGIHRLVRISPFNAEGKRQTSFAAVDVSPEVSDSVDIDVNWDEDIREDVFRASGAGGQHVNKTSSAIRLTHMPTGTVVQCQNERSQHKNRATARKMMLSQLARIEEERREAEQAAKYGQMAKVGFGSQIRSYFLHPDQRIKDARTGHLVGNFHSVLDGNIQGFLDAYLHWKGGRGEG
jgi:peptide chain release factor 2